MRIDTSQPGRSSCSLEESRRSTTSVSLPARTMVGPSSSLGKDGLINRQNYTTEEVQAAIRRPVVQRILRLIQLRNSYPAFDGTLEVSLSDPSTLLLSWRNGDAQCVLQVDIASSETTITAQQGGIEPLRFSIGRSARTGSFNVCHRRVAASSASRWLLASAAWTVARPTTPDSIDSSMRATRPSTCRPIVGTAHRA